MGYGSAFYGSRPYGGLSEPVSANQTVAVAQAVETNTATALTIPVIGLVGQATETNTAGTITPVLNGVQIVSVGQSVETNTAFGVTVTMGPAPPGSPYKLGFIPVR